MSASIRALGINFNLEFDICFLLVIISSTAMLLCEFLLHKYTNSAAHTMIAHS